MIGAYICTKCTIEYWPKLQQVKKSSKFDLPGPPTDSHGNVIGDNDIPIAVIDDVNKGLYSATFKRQNLENLYFSIVFNYYCSDPLSGLSLWMKHCLK
jgi:hypothetical protein